MKSHFRVIDLPFGEWAVAWDPLRPELNGRRVMEIIFTEMRHFEATLGVQLRNGELENLRIDAGAYYQHHSRTEDFV